MDHENTIIMSHTNKYIIRSCDRYYGSSDKSSPSFVLATWMGVNYISSLIKRFRLALILATRQR